MRASQIFVIALLGGILYVLVSGRGHSDESDGDTDGFQAAKAYVPRGAGLEWTEDGNLNFSLRFPSASPAAKHNRKTGAEINERGEARFNPYDRVPD